MLLALITVAASVCTVPERKPYEALLPMNDAAPAFIAGHCAVPVTRTTERHGLSEHVLVRHVCDDQRDHAKRTLSMVVQFDETTRRITELQLLVRADDAAVMDAEFDRAYAAMIDPYVTPVMRGTIQKFSKQTFNGSEWWERDPPGGTFKITAYGEPEAYRWLQIQVPIDHAR
ncbi:MAG: hypothetical protein K8W52_29280 [Deltaproteobacteria bacterium]|nr:hypothetical protein [Deltaproteobacteria bacterium]